MLVGSDSLIDGLKYVSIILFKTLNYNILHSLEKLENADSNK